MTARKKPRKKKFVARAFLAIFAVAVISIAGCGAYRRAKEWSVFAVRTVCVTGVEEELLSKVREASGIEAGVSLLDLDLGLVKRRLESLDFIREARIGRRPSGRVVLRILERQPFAVVNGRLVVGEDGIQVFSIPPDSALPHVTCVVRGEGKGRRSVDPAVLGEAVGLLAMAESLGPAEVDASLTSDFRLLLEDGTVVRLGSGGFQKKLKMISLTIEDLNQRRRRFSQLDARFASQVLVRS